MRNVEQRIEGFIRAIPDELRESLVSDRLVVLSLVRKATEKLSGEKPGFHIVGFKNELRASYNPHLILTLNRVYPVNDFLLHFLDIADAMGIKDPILSREWIDVRFAAVEYERGFTGDNIEGASKEEYERFKKRYETRDREGEQRYFRGDVESIVEYVDSETAYEQNCIFEYKGKRFIEAEKHGRRITLLPTQEPIGNFSPIVVLEAYLLYLLEQQKSQ